MGYTALYRKFRPDTFADVKGQDAVVTALKNQIRANRLGHAYLFCGTRGTGKTSIAKIFARAVNCEHPVDGSPCNECAACRGIASGAWLNVIEIDAASNNGVDNIREIREEVAYSPAQGKYKVYIIDEVHMLSIGAFNALLKTLEEPPAYVIFILATTEAHKIPVTILSRCQRYDFRRIGQDTICERLQELVQKEQVDAEEKALRYVAKKGDGSLRDALSLLDQCIACCLGETLTYKKVLDVLGAVDTEVYSDLLRKIIGERVTEVIGALERLIMRGTDLTQFVSDFTWYLRNLMLIKASDEMEDVLDVSAENLIQLREEAAMVRQDTLMRYIRIFSELSGSIRYATNKRVLLEMALIRLCTPEAERDELSLLERIRKLERKMEQGYLPAAQPAQAAPVYPAADMGGYPEGFSGEPYGYGDYPGEAYLYEGGAAQRGQAAAAAGSAGAPGETPGQEPPRYQTAAPGDLQQVKAMWKSIVAETGGMFRIMLAAAEPKFNPRDEKDGKLYVVFSDFLAERYLDRRERMQELEQIIAEKTGKQIEVRFLLAADEGIQRSPLARIDVEQRAREVIHTEIEIEDE